MDWNAGAMNAMKTPPTNPSSEMRTREPTGSRGAQQARVVEHAERGRLQQEHDLDQDQHAAAVHAVGDRAGGQGEEEHGDAARGS